MNVLPLMLSTLIGGADAGPAYGRIQTVLGPVEPWQLGPTLTHEHVLVDFVGAEQVSPERYDADEAFRTMLPYLVSLREAGIEALTECTPDYLGRDVGLLKRLSLASGVRLITNTGLYKDPFLPAWAHGASAEELALHWIEEARSGIGPERVRPGFIKIAVNEGDLVEVQRKIVRAAALASKSTGLPIAAHTTKGVSALQELDILADVGCPASHLIVVHSDAEPDEGLRFRVASRGAWLSYDGIRQENAAQKVEQVRRAFERYPDQLLISQDAGWYNVGRPGGGDIVPWDWLPRHFVPMLRNAGLSEADVRRLLVANAARAFTVRRPVAGS